MTSRLRVTAAVSFGMAVWAMVGRAAPLQRVVDENDRAVLYGNVHPMVRAEFDAGRTAGSLPAERTILALAMSPEKKAALERLLVEQQEPGSPNFHHWLTPQEFGARFGATLDEIALVTGWLQSHGFIIDEVGKSKTWISFTGTVADVESAFRTEIHDLCGRRRRPSRELSRPIDSKGSRGSRGGRRVSQRLPPEACEPHRAARHDREERGTLPLAGRLRNDLQRESALQRRSQWRRPEHRRCRAHQYQPRRCSVLPKHLQPPPNDPQFIINYADPGIVDPDDEVEADLDVEWSGAVAPDATIKVVISPSIGFIDGVFLSALYIVDNNVAPVLTASYGFCEASMGSSLNQAISTLWAQAAAEGISVFVASGDRGRSRMRCGVFHDGQLRPGCQWALQPAVLCVRGWDAVHGHVQPESVLVRHQ